MLDLTETQSPTKFLQDSPHLFAAQPGIYRVPLIIAKSVDLLCFYKANQVSHNHSRNRKVERIGCSDLLPPGNEDTDQKC